MVMVVRILPIILLKWSLLSSIFHYEIPIKNHNEFTIQFTKVRGSSLTSNTLHGELPLPSGKLT